MYYQQGVRNFESSIGLIPTKTGYDEKTPGYLLKKSQVLKMIALVFGALAVLSVLYYRDVLGVRTTSWQLEQAKVDNRLLERQLSTKLMNMEMELEHQLLKRRQHGEMGRWFVHQLHAASVDYRVALENKLRNIKGEKDPEAHAFESLREKVEKSQTDETHGEGPSLTDEQVSEIIKVVQDGIDKHTKSVESLSTMVTDKLEVIAKYAQERAQILKGERDVLFKEEIDHQKEFENIINKAGMTAETLKGYDMDKINGQTLEFVKKLKDRVLNFFSIYDNYGKQYVPTTLTVHSPEYSRLQDIRNHIEEDQRNQNKNYAQLQDLVVAFSNELSEAYPEISHYRPSEEMPHEYISSLRLRVLFPSMAELTRRWHDDLQQGRRVFDLMRDMMAAADQGQVPREWLEGKKIRFQAEEHPVHDSMDMGESEDYPQHSPPWRGARS